MKFTCEREPFKTGLELVEKALPVRSTIPVINNILMEIEQKRLRFTATNLELDIRYQLEEGIAGSNQDLSFKVLLPPKIVNITRHLPAEDIIMDTTRIITGLISPADRPSLPFTGRILPIFPR